MTLVERVGTVGPMSHRRASWITAAAVAALAFAVFANSLSNGLTMEDVAAIASDAQHHPLDWRAILLGPSGGDADIYRPLTSWTFAADHALHGDSPFGYHLVNGATSGRPRRHSSAWSRPPPRRTSTAAWCTATAWRAATRTRPG